MNSIKPHLIFAVKVLGVLVVYGLLKPFLVKILPAKIASYLP